MVSDHADQEKGMSSRNIKKEKLAKFSDLLQGKNGERRNSFMQLSGFYPGY